MNYRLADLPKPVKVLITAFLALVAGGYGSALLNIYTSHRHADGDPALTFDDLVAVFHGLDKQITGPPPSRMLRMIRTAMRDKFSSAKQFRALEAWLLDGAPEAGWTLSDHPQSGDPAPEDVIADRCLRCHNQESGEKRDAPFGPDVISPDLQMVQRFAVADAEVTSSRQFGPTGFDHLVLITHAHMLAIPVFTLIVAGLFFMTALPNRLRAMLGCAPMFALLVDFASWWLARLSIAFVYCIALAGALFGVTFASQVVLVLASLWWGRRSTASDRDTR